MPGAETAAELLERGNALYGTDNREAAADCYRRALLLDPGLSAASYNLGCALDALAGPSQALPHYLQAASRCPGWWQARSSLGFALARVGRMAEAACELEAAAALNPNDAGIRNNLGLALSALGRGGEAHASFLAAIRLNPHYPEALSNLAILYEQYGRTSEAISSCLEALALRPGYPEAHLNLANALKSQGRHDEALAHYREALRLKPGYDEAHSSLLFALCYPAGLSRDQICAEHLAFGAAHRFPIAPHENDPSPDRTLRIGYVSADFRAHAVARFIEPVLRNHDRSRFQIFCYSNVSVPDAASASLGELAGHTVNIAGMPDQEAAELIRRDRIDILVDLSGHTAGNRLPLFARKPAPVQVTWLGYPQTTGLRAMDYRITDAATDPPGESERFYSEKLLRLPDNFSCFAPPEGAPAPTELPALSSGMITFGSFNNPAKITPQTVALWAAALHGVRGSRMLIKGYALADPGSRTRLIELFALQGIAAERLDLQGNTVSYQEHLQLYGKVDIALDSFPYHGTTTTCEALWMGVPVVTLTGDTHLSRVGASLLKSVGLSGLVAEGAQGYRDRAVSLSQDLGRLALLRGTLRDTMAASTLTDAAGFTAHLEQAFRAIWRNWIATVQEDPAEAATGTAAGIETVTETDLAAKAARFLQEGNLDRALASFLAALRSDPSDTAPLAGIEEILNRQMAADLRAGCRRDAVRLGVTPQADDEPSKIRKETLEEAAVLLLARGFLTPADLICRYLQDRGYRSRIVSHTLGEIALSLGASSCAAGHFLDAIELGDGRHARIQLLKAEEAARLLPVAATLTRPAVAPAPVGGRDSAYPRPPGEGGRRPGEGPFAMQQPAQQSCRVGNAHRDIPSGGRCPPYTKETILDLMAVPGEGPSREGTPLIKQSADRFLLIKAWGYGFWSDVNHLLGQCLLAEITGRIPVVHWGGNSLFSDDPTGNAFESFFEPVSSFTLAQLASGSRSYYPPKWSVANLHLDGINQAAGPWSRSSSLYVLERSEEVVVSDFHYAVHDLVPWIPAGHRLHGMTTDQLYLYLFQRYLKVKPALSAKVEAFFEEKLAGCEYLALHIRGGDKGGEDPNLAQLNSLYPVEVERQLRENPKTGLFLITDDAEILAGYQQRYGDRVVHTGVTRTDSPQGVHYQKQASRRRLGEEVLVDTLLAARCQRFVGNGLSNVSCAVAQMKSWPPGSCRLLGARLDRLRQLTFYRS